MTSIHLVLLSENATSTPWDLGQVFSCPPKVKAISTLISENLSTNPADAWLFWDSGLGRPDKQLLLTLLGTASDCWHAGLALGLEGKPEMIDFAAPTWMLNRDPDSSIEATSWRLSLRACLIRTEVLSQLGGPSAAFESLEAAGLELGFRYIRKGAFIRHVPSLLGANIDKPKVDISLNDQLLFIKFCFGEKWLRWAALRGCLTRFAKPVELIRAWRHAHRQAQPEESLPFRRAEYALLQPVSGKVSVLIPTLRRYPYLRVVLDQLRSQTAQPLEILVVDQSPLAERDPELEKEFTDLPVRWFYLDQAGQCSSRNFGIQKSVGEFILFLDDDDEIEPDLIQGHLEALARYQTDISNGVAVEMGAGELPSDFRFARISDVFPTNNTLIRKSILCKSGLFDLAYDHGQRADHDLGMRLYLQGENLVINPETKVLHHHAPMGGLREHGARVNTYASSRSQLFAVQLPTVSDLYLCERYFSTRQILERMWIDVLGTFIIKGSIWKQMIKAVIATLSLPRSIQITRQRAETARLMLVEFPKIPDCDWEVD